MGVFDFTAYNSKVYVCLDELWRTNEKTLLSVIYCRYRDPQLLFLPSLHRIYAAWISVYDKNGRYWKQGTRVIKKKEYTGKSPTWSICKFTLVNSNRKIRSLIWSVQFFGLVCFSLSLIFACDWRKVFYAKETVATCYNLDTRPPKTGRA